MTSISYRLPLLLFFLPFVVTSAARAGLSGDIDLDCDIDVADAVMLERHLAGYFTLTGEQAPNANIPMPGGVRDQQVDIGDLITLRRMIAGDMAKPTPAFTKPTITIVSGGGTNPVLSVEGTGPTGIADLRAILYINGRRLDYSAPVNPSNGGFIFGNASGNRLHAALFDGQNHITAIVTKGFDHSCSSVAQTVTYHPDPLDVLSGTELNFSGSSLPMNTMVWSPELSTDESYNVTADLTVANGQALYIQPGVELKFAQNAKLKVASGGILQIMGLPGQMVNLVFDGTCGPTQRWGGIEVSSVAATDTFPRTYVQYAKLSCVTTGLKVNANASGVIANSEIDNFSLRGVDAALSANYVGIDFNVLTGATVGQDEAIGIETEGNGTFIRGNIITATGYDSVGLQSTTTAAGVVERNVIKGSSHAGVILEWENDSVFTQNTITDNCKGVKIHAHGTGPRPHLVGNSIFDNNRSCTRTNDYANNKDLAFGDNGSSQRSLQFNATGFVDVTGNWWGSTDPTFIASRLDLSHFPYPERFAHKPFLTAPWDQANFWIGLPHSTLITHRDLGDANKPAPIPEWVIAGDIPLTPTSSAAGTTLTIPDGQVIRFLAGSSLVVGNSNSNSGSGTGKLVVQDQGPADAIFTGFVPPGATPERGHWTGIVVEPKGSATIKDATIQYAVRGIEAKRGTGSQRAFVSLRNSVIQYLTRAGVILDRVLSTSEVRDSMIDGTISEGPPLKSVKDQPAYHIPGIQVIDSFDNCTSGTCGSISGNTIRRFVTGIHVLGASDPLILDNVITENIWGVWLQETTGRPSPVINRNQIFANEGLTPVPYLEIKDNNDPAFRLCSTLGGANLCLSGYTTSGTPGVIDAKQNYWGVLTPESVRGSVKIGEGKRVAVDVSEFRNAQSPPNIIGPPDLLSAVVSNVVAVGGLSGVGGQVIRPTISPPDDLDITYYLHRPANILIEIFGESDDTTIATPQYSFPIQSQAAGGPYTQSWDGRKDDTGHKVPDNAYVFVITAKHPASGDVLDRFDPPAKLSVFSSSVPAGFQAIIVGDRGYGTEGPGSLTTFNSFVNDYLTFNYLLRDDPDYRTPKFSSRVTAKIFYGNTLAAACDAGEGTGIGSLVATPWLNKPLWADFHTFVWDGRVDATEVSNFEPGDVLSEDDDSSTRFCVYFEVPQPLKPNHVIVTGTTPSITGIGAAPEIEVKADPYVVQPSYEQSSLIKFKVNRSALVKLYILPPGQLALESAVAEFDIDGSPAEGIQPIPGGEVFPYHWKGYAEMGLAGETNALAAQYDGTYTFALKAWIDGQPELSSVYRGVLEVTGEGEAP